MRPSSVACDQYVPCVAKDLWWIWILASHFQEAGRSFPRVRPLAWHAHAGRLQTASCLWLRPRITDRPEFSSFQTLTRHQTGHAGARVRSAARTSLFQALWRLESRGGSVRDLHLHLHAAGPGYCCRSCLPRSPCVSLFNCSGYQSLPKGRMPVVHLAWALGEQCGPGGAGVCAGTEVTLAALARDRTGSRSCAQSAVNASGGMRS